MPFGVISDREHCVDEPHSSKSRSSSDACNWGRVSSTEENRTISIKFFNLSVPRFGCVFRLHREQVCLPALPAT